MKALNTSHIPIRLASVAHAEGRFISESDFDYCKLHEGVISAAIQGVVSLLKIINIASSFCWEPLVWQVLSL